MFFSVNTFAAIVESFRERFTELRSFLETKYLLVSYLDHEFSNQTFLFKIFNANELLVNNCTIIGGLLREKS